MFLLGSLPNACTFPQSRRTRSRWSRDVATVMVEMTLEMLMLLLLPMMMR